jgi:hypothetical protein
MSVNPVSHSSLEDVQATGGSDAVKSVSHSSLEDVQATGGSDTREETSEEPGNSYPPNEEDLEFGEPDATDLVSPTTLPHGQTLDELVSHSSLEDVQATGGSDTCERH